MKGTAVVLVLVLGLISCGGGGEAPRTGGPSPVITGLAISSSTDLLKINQSETFTVTATMSNGSTSTVTATWRSETPAVATVDANGRVTGVGSGDTTISAEASGVHATPRTIRVLPDYQGRWSGDWRVAGCTTDGDWRRTDICRDVPIDSLLSFALTLTQDRDTASGNVTLDDVAGPVQGPIRSGGHVNLAGAFTSADDGIVLDITVSDWETTTTDNQRMTGRFTLAFRATGLQGSVRFDGELRIVAKSGAASLSATGGQLRLRRALAAAARR
jgi:Bacterial Ig-like domain (group 2)